MGTWEGLWEKKGGMMQSCFNETLKKNKVFICILESILFTRYLTQLTVRTTCLALNQSGHVGYTAGQLLIANMFVSLAMKH